MLRVTLSLRGITDPQPFVVLSMEGAAELTVHIEAQVVVD